MKYLVIFNSNDGKMCVKDLKFNNIFDADKYADSVAISREPMVIPVVNMRQEFTPQHFGVMAELVTDIGQTLLFQYEEAGVDPIAEQLFLEALAHLELTATSLKKAEIFQMRGGLK